MMNGASIQLNIKLRNVLRALEILLIMFVFCPSFLVSCAGSELKVNVFTAVMGVTTKYGRQAVAPQPIMLICLILPIVMLVVMFRKKIGERVAALITIICAIIDIIFWILFDAAVEILAEENYCEYKTTAVYTINLIVLIAIALLSAAVIMKRMRLDTDFVKGASDGVAQRTINPLHGTVSQKVGTNVSTAGATKASVIGYCRECGTEITFGSRFCFSCGTSVPESVIMVAEEKRRAEEEAEAIRKAAEQRYQQTVAQADINRPMFCHQCGKRMNSDTMFCGNCGAKVE